MSKNLVKSLSKQLDLVGIIADECIKKEIDNKTEFGN